MTGEHRTDPVAAVRRKLQLLLDRERPADLHVLWHEGPGGLQLTWNGASTGPRLEPTRQETRGQHETRKITRRVTNTEHHCEVNAASGTLESILLLVYKTGFISLANTPFTSVRAQITELFLEAHAEGAQTGRPADTRPQLTLMALDQNGAFLRAVQMTPQDNSQNLLVTALSQGGTPTSAVLEPLGQTKLLQAMRNIIQHQDAQTGSYLTQYQHLHGLLNERRDILNTEQATVTVLFVAQRVRLTNHLGLIEAEEQRFGLRLTSTEQRDQQRAGHGVPIERISLPKTSAEHHGANLHFQQGRTAVTLTVRPEFCLVLAVTLNALQAGEDYELSFTQPESQSLLRKWPLKSATLIVTRGTPEPDGRRGLHLHYTETDLQDDPSTLLLTLEAGLVGPLTRTLFQANQRTLTGT